MEKGFLYTCLRCERVYCGLHADGHAFNQAGHRGFSRMKGPGVCTILGCDVRQANPLSVTLKDYTATLDAFT